MILAVDTTGERLSLAVSDGVRLWRRETRSSKPQDEILFPELRRLLKRAKGDFSALQSLAVASGPGRFTGIRIGMTFASILGRALKCPVIAVSRFEVVAHKAWCCGYWEEQALVVAFPALRGEFFLQFFLRLKRGPKSYGQPLWVRSGQVVQILKDVGRSFQITLSGPSAQELGKLCKGRYPLLHGWQAPISAADLIEPAKERLSSGKPGILRPLYLKPANFEPQARNP